MKLFWEREFQMRTPIKSGGIVLTATNPNRLNPPPG